MRHFGGMGLSGLLLILNAIGGAALAQGTAGTVLKAAAGKVDITPTRPAYIAGYGENRKSIGAHDPLMARCLVLEEGGVRVAFVSCDVIGVPRYQAERIRAEIKTVRPENVYISATHTHSGPDTIGQWGPDIQTSGVDQEWMTSFRAKAAALVDATSAALKPATLRFASTKKVPPVSKNSRVPRILDTELAVMQAVGSDNKIIATFVNFACHPEILNNHNMSADFPHWLYETVEAKTGAVCLYLNGAQGGMVTADFDESTTPKGENWAAAESIGTGLGQRALEIIGKAEPASDVIIQTQRRVFDVPMDNQRFKALIALKVFPAGMLKNGAIETEVNRIVVGPAEFLTLPGEALPNIGFFLKRHMTGEYKFLLGLTCDELGYILAKEDYGLDLYAYETSVSVGEKMAPMMVDSLLALMQTRKAGAAAAR